MTEREQELVKETIAETIRQLKEQGLLQSVSASAYRETSQMLTAYYQNGEKRAAILEAIESLKGDKYFKILPLYFEKNCTIAEIAEAFDVEISTISRNKKRLCLQIYERAKNQKSPG